MPVTITAKDQIEIASSQATIWKLLCDFENYSNWWPTNLGIKLIEKKPQLIGTLLEVNPKGGKSFRCTVDTLWEPNKMRLKYSGFVEGQGEFLLEAREKHILVTYSMDIVANGFAAWIFSKLVNFSELHSKMIQGVLKNLEIHCLLEEHKAKA